MGAARSFSFAFIYREEKDNTISSFKRKSLLCNLSLRGNNGEGVLGARKNDYCSPTPLKLYSLVLSISKAFPLGQRKTNRMLHSVAATDALDEVQSKVTLKE